MGTRKVSLTLPDELVARAENAVQAGRARSVSGYIAAAAGSGEAKASIDEVIARWRTEEGQPTPTQVAEAQDRAQAYFQRADRGLRVRDAA